MNLERVAVKLRPRSAWEAIDLGFALARSTWRRLYGAWLAVYAPAALVVFSALHAHPLWALATMIWLKPLFDRVALHVLGASVFDEPPSVRATLRALPQALTPGLLASLTLYRFDTARSFNLPIWQLERQRGLVARRRAAVLHKRARGAAVWLTLVCIHFEGLVLGSLIGSIDLLIPEPYHLGIDPFLLFHLTLDRSAWEFALQAMFYVAAVSIVEPCYVAAGFALYLNRRTQLEAWDIELALRRMANRRDTRALAATAALALLLSAVVYCTSPQSALAQATQTSTAKQTIVDVLKQPEFDEYKETTGWRYRGPGSWWNESKDSPSKSPSTAWMALGHALASALRALGWIAVAAIVVAALVYASRYLAGGGALRATRWQPPGALFGLDVRPESLPDDIAARALELIAAQRIAEALGLLYRGALSQLVHHDGVELASGATEGDCLRAVAERKPPATSDYFGRLVQAWSAAAYANRIAQQALAEALAHEWRTHFPPAPAT